MVLNVLVHESVSTKTDQIVSGLTHHESLHFLDKLLFKVKSIGYAMSHYRLIGK